MFAMRLSLIALRIATTALGSCGVMSVWFSFHDPAIAVYALLCLGTATGMFFAMEKHQ